MLAVSAPNSKDAPGFVAEHGYTFDFGIDTTGDALQQYGVRGIPHTLFIDRHGRIVDQKIGGMERAEFEERLAKIL